MGFITNGQGGLTGDRQIAAFTQVRSLDTGPRNDLPNVLVVSGCDAGWFEHWGVASLHAVERYVLTTRSWRLKVLALTAAIVLYCGVAVVLTHYWVISGLNDASAMACHGILDRRSVIVCHADVLPPHRRLTIIEEADMKLQSPLPHWGHQSGRTRATP